MAPKVIYITHDVSIIHKVYPLPSVLGTVAHVPFM